MLNKAQEIGLMEVEHTERERDRESGSEKEEKERVTTHAEVTQVAELES